MTKKAVLWRELIPLISLVVIISLAVIPFVNNLSAALRIPDSIENQFKQLIIDIEATPADGQEYKYGFAVNKEKEIYRLEKKLACLDEAEEKNDCLKRAKLCLTHITEEKQPICEEIKNGNFKKEGNKIFPPVGGSITIKKNPDGIIEFYS